MRTPRMGDIYRIRRRYEKPGPPFIRVFTIHARQHMLRVFDYMEDGQLASERGWGQDGYRWHARTSKLPRWFSDETGWPKLAKYWTLIRKPEAASALVARTPGEKV